MFNSSENQHTNLEKSSPRSVHMDDSFDALRKEFERLKLRSQQNEKEARKLMDDFKGEIDISELKTNLWKLRKGMTKLEKQQLNKACWLDPNAIEDFPIPLDDFGEDDQDPLKKKPKEEKLVIDCGPSLCHFEHCRRHVDSQLLLLHYSNEHGHKEKTGIFQRCHRLYENQRLVLSFEARRVQLNQHQVIGLIDYGGALEQKQLPPKDDVPVAVLICKTACQRRSNSTQTDEAEVFIIWLVTPKTQLKLNAKLSLCGRDEATRMSTMVHVRRVRESQKTCRFRPAEGNYWKLSSHQMEKISNRFRDELQLELSLTKH